MMLRVVGRGVVGLLRSDHVVEQRLAGQLVAEVLGPDEAGGIDGDDGLAELLAGRLQTALMSSPIMAGTQVLIDEDRRRIVFLDDFLDRLVETLLAAEHDVGFVDVGGESGAP